MPPEHAPTPRAHLSLGVGVQAGHVWLTHPLCCEGPCSCPIIMAVQNAGSVRLAQTVRLPESWAVCRGAGQEDTAGDSWCAWGWLWESGSFGDVHPL